MFSGIIEDTQRVVKYLQLDKSIRIWITRPIRYDDLKIGDSVSVNGVCLTLEEQTSDLLQFLLGYETLLVTQWNIKTLENLRVNLERSLKWGDRIHGHMVSGHVDTLTQVLNKKIEGECVILELTLPAKNRKLVSVKGSVALNGVSLTVNDISNSAFTVCLIPETLRKTNLQDLSVGHWVNLECDHFSKNFSRNFSETISNLHEVTKFHSTQELINDIKLGKMVVLVDSEDRENEGDLVLAADFVTAEKINFMAAKARGLICLALHEDQVKRLNLPQMVAENQNDSPNKTAFTVSIEAARGVTTGISASDRSHTIKVASNPLSTPRDIHMPGHIFPIKAQRDGVLARTGHTEGSVDLALLAGLNPAAVICEVMNEDGTMARVPELLQFAKIYDLKIGSIKDLIQYRLDGRLKIL